MYILNIGDLILPDQGIPQESDTILWDTSPRRGRDPIRSKLQSDRKDGGGVPRRGEVDGGEGIEVHIYSS